MYVLVTHAHMDSRENGVSSLRVPQSEMGNPHNVCTARFPLSLPLPQHLESFVCR